LCPLLLVLSFPTRAAPRPFLFIPTDTDAAADDGCDDDDGDARRIDELAVSIVRLMPLMVLLPLLFVRAVESIMLDNEETRMKMEMVDATRQCSMDGES